MPAPVQEAKERVVLTNGANLVDAANLFHNQRYHEASHALHRAVALAPRSGEGWLLLGVTQFQAAAVGADFGDAVASLRRATGLLPRNADAHWQLGDALAARGENRRAVASFAAALRVNPELIEAYSSLARVVAYEVSNARAARLALRCYRLALRVSPTHHETLHNLGEHFVAQGDSRAVKSFERAVTAAPSSAPTVLGLAESLQRLCRLGEARHHYERAATLLPRSARAQLHALMPLVDASASRERAWAVERARPREAPLMVVRGAAA